MSCSLAAALGRATVRVAPNQPGEARGRLRVIPRASEGGESAKVVTVSNGKTIAQRLAEAAQVSLGPIGLTLGGDVGERADGRTGNAMDLSGMEGEAATRDGNGRGESIATMTTEEWRRRYEEGGRVDLFVEEEFNAGSRLVGGRDVHLGRAAFGTGTGEGRSVSDAPTHRVSIKDTATGKVFEVDVPEDRYILWEAEDKGLELPYACRMGCCTACAVKVKSGELFQYQALGVSRSLREEGYALMCVAFPLSDVELETVAEDEVYDKQFGHIFAQYALNKDGSNVQRDDFAFELADMDE